MPSLEDVPHLDMQVVNYHRPVLGTFHSKFMIIDRKIGMTQSNNIQVSETLPKLFKLANVDGPQTGQR